MRRHKILSLLISVIILVSLLLPSEASEKHKYTDYIYDAFDTNISITAYCDNEEQFRMYMDIARDEFQRLHKLFDIYNPYPGIHNAYTVNVNAGITPVQTDIDLIQLIELSRGMYLESDGAVNIAMGAVLKLWHACREYNVLANIEPLLPSFEKLSVASEHTDFSCIVTDQENSTVYISDRDASLDLGAAAKGYAVESVSVKLIDAGCKSFAVNAGGNVRVHGVKPNGENWNVGITDPFNTAKTIASVSVTDRSVVTSGVYQRFFTVGNTKYHHIIDGNTLYPETRYLSVTVITENSAKADLLSTALFNMDYPQSRAFADSIDDTEAMWILPDGTMEYTEGFYSSVIY